LLRNKLQLFPKNKKLRRRKRLKRKRRSKTHINGVVCVRDYRHQIDFLRIELIGKFFGLGSFVFLYLRNMNIITIKTTPMKR